MSNILLYFGHPSQYLFFKNAIQLLKTKSINCDLLIRSKDVLERLLIENNESYHNILPEGRNSGDFGTLIGLLKRDIRLYKYIIGKKYDLLIGTDPSLAHIGFLKRIPVITVLEDDINVIPKLAKTTFPFTSVILTPNGCKTGRHEHKTIHYAGYMKLAYLHPGQFLKKSPILEKPYFLIRLSKLDAHHDKNIHGFYHKLLKELIEKLEQNGNVYISSEGDLENDLLKYQLKINPAEMQQILANAKLFVSDSQSMSMEAAMLGVPSVRFSDFTGKISVLEELEHIYKLTFGIGTNSPSALFNKIDELLSIKDPEKEFEKRRSKMLNDKINVTPFLVWFIEDFPESFRIMKENPDYQYRFR